VQNHRQISKGDLALLRRLAITSGKAKPFHALTHNRVRLLLSLGGNSS
jgi:hypothetical protein